MDTKTDDQFPWGSDESVVLPTRMGIAVYFNPKGDVVIRQEDQFDQSEDDWIAMSPADACKIAFRILDLVEGEDPVAYCEGGRNAESRPRPKDLTAAERQRRRRDRLRGSDNVTATVTHLDRDTLRDVTARHGSEAA